ncbi:MAG: hypothetical protein US50_C0023G0007 [Candidatus Nomurabacteria bacterium GW2011_GWB1_37_5]|uniref:Transcriptional regulator, AbiEi antitoxin, Type IV TA system n=1 Tax=Candidatus Nomurabacteria bacterium GW2011_GWB1_37_5 TaxID=1618742 RepID=A0A0G0H9H2_9BACT|nr:MAG: hypothetical protein US50_C0023G0007 [Candidatus Nomurabacteria bacterium GW2011_GWB1_37_5]
MRSLHFCYNIIQCELQTTFKVVCRSQMNKKLKKGQYLEVLLRSSRTVFSTKDAALLWGEEKERTITSRLNKYVKAGKLVRVRRGIYAKDNNYDRFEVATRIYTPSYISFETVLTEAGINFQFYKKITAASYQTREIIVDGQTYSYKKIKNIVLTNPAGVIHKGETSVASPERAFLDTIYIHKDYHFDNLGSLNWDKVFEILPIYKNNRMAKKVNEFFEHHKAIK